MLRLLSNHGLIDCERCILIGPMQVFVAWIFFLAASTCLIGQTENPITLCQFYFIQSRALLYVCFVMLIYSLVYTYIIRFTFTYNNTGIG